ncbi:MAG TPA: alpha/beta fold hydrolase [Methylomirabilota bacterium]|jgi:pimeloyl-ACP methyl ester carboxylesterase|nr:alpha/beta fold hydrolase [Methylomirabilota bacterium]
MPIARVNGIDLHYQEMGPSTAPPLVLVMGWGGDHTAWAFQFPAFSTEYRVVAFDNRGAGQSQAPDLPYTIAGMAEDTLALLDALGIARAHVAGVSMGGMIAQEIALKQPERVLTLQLHCTLARPDAYGAFLVTDLLRVKARGDREEFARTTVPWLLSRRTLAENPDFVRFLIDRAVDYPYPTGLAGLTRQAEAIGSHDTLDRLAQIRLPTLVTVGADDILVPPRFSQEIHARIPTSELVMIPDAGHLHFMEQFERFNEVCLTFLRKHRAA